MKTQMIPDGFFAEVYHVRNWFLDLGETVSRERLAFASKYILRDVLFSGKCGTVKKQAIRDSDLGLTEISSVMRTIFTNDVERCSASTKGHERKNSTEND